MTERLIQSRVIDLGTVLAKRVPNERMEFHRWIVESLTGEFCSNDGYDTTIYFELSSLIEDPGSISGILGRSISEARTERATVLIDLTTNPYDLMRDPFLHSVASFSREWAGASESRMVVILIPQLPPRQSSMFWPPLMPGLSDGSVVILTDEGKIVSDHVPRLNLASHNVLDGYAQRHAAFRTALEKRIATKTLRKLGHFSVEDNASVQCARFFFDSSLAVGEIARAIEERVRRRILPVVDNLTLVTHGPRSSWLHEAALIAADRLGAGCLDISQFREGDPHVDIPGVGVLIFDVVNTGTTARNVIRQLRAAQVPLASRAFAVLADRQAPRTIDSPADVTIDSTVTVESKKVPQSGCAQCASGLPYTNPQHERCLALRAFDAWDMFLSAPWVEEPYGPAGLPLFTTAPDMREIFLRYGDYLAYKIEYILDSLRIRGELVFVCPDEDRVNVLMEHLSIRFNDRLVAVRLPRSVLERNGQTGTATTDRAGWQLQLQHLGRSTTASVIVLDEFNASATTAGAIIRALRLHGVKPDAYIPIVDREARTHVEEVRVFSLYSIPSPRNE